MRGLSVLIEPTKGITNPAVLRRLQAAMLDPAEPEPGQIPYAPHGPRYEVYRPWYKRFIAKGCARCGGEPTGWLQRQIQTPGRFKRTILWLVNLIPRGASLIRVVTSKQVGWSSYVERNIVCGACPSAVIELRVLRGTIHETMFCAMCSCPHWFGSRLDYKNRKMAHRCPLHRHAGSDPDSVYREHVRAKSEFTASGEDSGRNGNDRGGTGDG